ncbi:MAG: hypothetical protein IJ043_02690 [Clostridia bacterium]|nr:hypothetical protein [Clostridia bacterium]
MTNQQLLTAIGGIDDRFITAGSKASKRYWIRWCTAAAACLCLIIVGIGLWQGGLFTKPEPLPTPGNTETVPEDTDNTFEAMGGDNHDYYYAYHGKLYRSISEMNNWLELQGIDIWEWWEQEAQATKQKKYTASDPEYVPILLNVIETFNFPREVFEKINQENIEFYQQYGSIEDVCFNKEELDALYSGDSAVITRVFASPYAIVAGDRAFAPYFYLNATEEELQSYGITQEMIQKKITLLRRDKIIESISPIDQYFDPEYDLPYQRRLYALGILDRLHPDQMIDAWANQNYNDMGYMKPATSTSDMTPRLLVAIERFEITKEEFEENNAKLTTFLKKYNHTYFIKSNCFTQEEIDVLFSGDREAIVRTFASPYAILSGGKAYAPDFYLNATAAELKTTGITEEMIEQKTELLYQNEII